MPFQALPENETAKPHSPDLALLVIRFLVVLAFLYYQLIDQLNLVRLHIWSKAEWSLVDSLSEMGIPLPSVVAVAAIVIMAIALLGILTGFFTRINGLIAFLLIGCAFFLPLELSKALSPQTLILYLAVFLGFAVGGGGKLSLDQALTNRKNAK